MFYQLLSILVTNLRNRRTGEINVKTELNTLKGAEDKFLPDF